MDEDQQTFLYYMRRGLQNPKPATVVFLASMIAFAAMITVSYTYYASRYGPIPSLNVGFMTKANMYYRDRKHDAAAAEYEGAAAIWPTNMRLVFNQGVNALNSGNAQKAIDTFEQFLQVDPDNPAIRHALGLSYATAGNYQAAIAHLLKATSLGPEAYLNLGAAYEAAGQLEQAAESYQRAEELAPGFPGAREKYDLVRERMRQ